MATSKVKTSVGQTVAFIRRNGERAVGRITARETTNGEWLVLNTAPKGSKTPQISKIRPSQAMAA